MFESIFGHRRRVVGRLERIERALDELRRAATAPRQSAVYLGDHQALTKLRSGERIFVDTRDCMMVPSILLDGVWEDYLVDAFVGTLQKGMTVLDVGASYGVFTLPAATAVGRGGKVYAVEPNPTVARLLRNSIWANFFSQVEVIEAAASDAASAVELSFSPHHTGGASIQRRHGSQRYPYEHDYEFYETVTVQAQRLDALIPVGARIDALKIDVEEAEVLAFAGMGPLLDHPRVILCEYRRSGIERLQSPLAFLEDFAQRGYALHIMAREGPTPPMTPAAIVDHAKDDLIDLFMRR